MNPRLSQATLDRLPLAVRRFGYDRSAVKAGVVHLGIGAFHRAHQAAVFDRLLHDDPRWAVRSASLRSSAVREQMAPQNGLYCLVEREGTREDVRVVGAVLDVLVAPENPDVLVEALAAPDTHVVTLTVTEKGYLPIQGERLAAPRSAAAFLAAGLGLRRERGLLPFTAISCDNLPHNGARLREAVLDLSDPPLRDWIGEHGAFPQTMVDRIVPATDERDIERLAGRTGLVDRAMVKAEPFLQWVIEDRFAGPRPDFEAAGVQVTRDVGPWEDAKLRLLNGAHSAIAYLGGLAGLEFVHQFVALPEGRRFVEALWDEAKPTLSPPPGLDLAAYRAALMTRFSNAALQHRTRQIAIDGSQKLPQRLLAPIATRLERAQPFPALALAVAAWIGWQGGRTDDGTAFEVEDPLSGEIARRSAHAVSSADTVEAVLGMRQIFPASLAAHPKFADALCRSLDLLRERGALGALRQSTGEVAY